MRKLNYIQSSVFVDDRYTFSGNQLATFWNMHENELTSDEMLGIAQEMNFSETTFIFPSEIKECIRKVRIFTPGTEIPFAGHPTIGTGYVLKYCDIIPAKSKEATLELGIGPIKVSYYNESLVQMHQQKPNILGDFKDINTIMEILGVDKSAINSDLPLQFISTGFPFLIVPFTSIEGLKAINLDVKLLKKFLTDNYPSKNILTFSLETVHADSHAHVRMFAPLFGVSEDPATGSAAGPLGVYIENHNLINQPKGETLIFEQGYEINRPSRLLMNCMYKGNIISEAIVGGKVKITAEGTFFLP